jgi:hypothetical protein
MPSRCVSIVLAALAPWSIRVALLGVAALTALAFNTLVLSAGFRGQHSMAAAADGADGVERRGLLTADRRWLAIAAARRLQLTVSGAEAEKPLVEIDEARQRLVADWLRRAEMPDGPGSAGRGSQQLVAPLPRGATSNVITSSIAAAPRPASSCQTPSVTVAPETGGRLQVRADSPCRAGQSWTIQNGVFHLTRRLDAQGQDATLVDLFQGQLVPFTATFADGHRAVLAVPGDLTGRVSKVAIVWQSDVNLELHAFEYAAAPGAAGHVSAASPGSAASALGASATDKGRGFLTRMDDVSPAGHKALIYTFIHSKAQTGGTVALAVEIAGTTDATCSGKPRAPATYQLFLLDQSGTVRQETHVLAPGCAVPSSSPARFKTGLIPDLRLRR